MQPANNILTVVLIASIPASCTHAPPDNHRNNVTKTDKPSPIAGKWNNRNRECNSNSVDINSNANDQLQLLSRGEQCLLSANVIGIDGDMTFTAYCNGFSENHPTIRSVSYNVNDVELLYIERYAAGNKGPEILRRCGKAGGK